MRAATILTFAKSLYLRGRQRLTTARRLSAYMSSRALATTTTSSYFYGQKINLSGISPANRSRSGPNSLHVDMSRGDNAQGILGAIRPFWAQWGLGRVPRSPSFFCVVIQRTFRQLHNGRLSPNLVTKHSSVSRRGIHKDIFKNFHFRGNLPPKSEIKNRSDRHLTQSRLQVMGCRDTVYSTL